MKSVKLAMAMSVMGFSAWAQDGKPVAPAPATPPAATPAPTAKPADLPSGKDVYEKYIAATGGREAYQKVKSRVTTMTMAVPAQNMKGDMVVKQVEGKLLAVITLAGLGEIKRGFDGTTAWESSPMTGTRIVTGPERAQLLLGTRLDGETRYEELYKSVECTGVEDVDGKAAYKVIATPKEGTPMVQFFDKESGLLVKSTMTQKSQMGELAVDNFITDYKPVDGVKVAHKTTTKVMGMEQILTIEKVENNTEIPASVFELPDDVKKLVEKQAAKPAEPKAEPKKDDSKK